MSPTSIEFGPEGHPWQCWICGYVIFARSSFFGDSTCPRCGSLSWIELRSRDESLSSWRRLRDLRAEVSVDELSHDWKIDLSNRKATDEDLVLLTKIEPILELDLSGTNVTDKGATALGELESLEVLELGDTTTSDEALTEVGKLQRLQVLGLNRTNISEN